MTFPGLKSLCLPLCLVAAGLFSACTSTSYRACPEYEFQSRLQAYRDSVFASWRRPKTAAQDTALAEAKKKALSPEKKAPAVPAKAKSDSSLAAADSMRKADSLAVLAAAAKKDSAKAPAKKKEKSDRPLVCRASPGSAEAAGGGLYILTGKVNCDYGNLNFQTSRAAWDKSNNSLACEGGMKTRLEEFSLSADRGGYDKRRESAWAQGNVHGVDTAGQHLLDAGDLSYSKKSRDLLLRGSPVIRKLYPDTVPGDGKDETDTLTIKAREITYNDSLREARARDQVEVLRGRFRIFCRNALYADTAKRIVFSGDPIARIDEDYLQGDTLAMLLAGEAVTGMDVLGRALGKYQRRDDSTGKIERVRMEGDSLRMAFAGEKLSGIDLRRRAVTTSFREDHPERLNRLAGDRIQMDFDGEKMNGATITGRAQSIYFHYENDAYKGRNEAEGDKMVISFNAGKVKQIHITGAAKGVYLGQPARVAGKTVSSDTTAPVETP